MPSNQSKSKTADMHHTGVPVLPGAAHTFILLVIPVLFVVLSLLAENSEIRSALASLDSQLIRGVQGAQFGEYVIGYFLQNAQSHFSLLLPVAAVFYGFINVWASGGVLGVAIALISVGLAYMIWTSFEFKDSNFLGLVAVPLGAALFAWLLKLILVVILGAFGTVIQCTGLLALPILCFERWHAMTEFLERMHKATE